MNFRQYQAEIEASRRSGRVDPVQPMELLDQAELNLGSTFVVPRPAVGNVVAMGQPIRFLDLQCAGARGQVVTVTVGSFLSQPELESQLGDVTGPLTGVIEFGSGAAFARLEFDIPSMSRLPAEPTVEFAEVNPYPYALIGQRYSGTSVVLPASSIRVYARNDNNMRYISNGGNPQNIIGTYAASAIDPTVFAHVAYGPAFGGNLHLRKSIYITEQFNPGDPFGSGIASGATTNRIGIPPFAKWVRFPRQLDSGATTLLITFTSSAQAATYKVLAQYQIAAASDGPILVPPGATGFYVTNNGPNRVYALSAIFDLAV